MQLGGTVTFCETFDIANSGIPSRTGGLDPNVWGVSRLSQYINPGQQMFNVFPPVHFQACDGTTPLVAPDNDVMVCNGQLREALNDDLSGVLDSGVVIALAMYPKQPFDFAGRTGTVSFDVSNDTHGGHAAWPEFWFTDLPIPAPFVHPAGPFLSIPQNGFGLRLDGGGYVGQQGSCPNGNNINVNRWTVESAIIVHNYVADDTNNTSHQANLAVLDCVINSPDNSGIMNHVEIRVSQSQIDVYATDAGTTAPLKHIAVLTNVNLGTTRGLVWMNDVHYNADKAFVANGLPSQREHTFVWDNLAFDGPFTYRDFSYDALDALTPYTGGAPGGTALPGSVNLGKSSDPGQASTWNVLNVPANPNPAVVRVLFNFFHGTPPTTFTITVNGHVHTVPWPYPDTTGGLYRTYAVTIPVTDLVPGTNVVQIGADQPLVTENVNIVLVNVPGGVPVLPGSVNTYP
jgi:hypothetical protein